MKKLLSGLTFMLMLLVAAVSFVTVSARKIVIIKDDNPDGVAPYSITFNEYYISIEEEVGYVVLTSDGESEVLGTCTVVIVNAENPNGYTLCSSIESDNYGTLTIVVTEEASLTGYVSEVTGQLASIVELHQQIQICE